MSLCYEPIGILHCPVSNPKEMPNFFTISDISGTIEVYEPYIQGLDGLEAGERIVVIFHFHLSQGYELMQRRQGTGPYKGVFSLCSPNRPNAIGMSVLQLTGINGGTLNVTNVDMVNGTPILDIKPCKIVPE